MDRFEPTEAGAYLYCVSQFGSHPAGSVVSVNESKRVLLGRITGVHGIKGEVVVHSYTEAPGDIAAYGELTDRDGHRTFSLQVVRVTEKGVVARVTGVGDRTAAEKLKGTELWILRARLPATADGEFYHADLIGLQAVSPEGRSIGAVAAVQNFGAGDLLEIRLPGSRRTELVPFTDACVPDVDIAAGRVVVRLPAASGGDDGPADSADDEP